MNDFTIVSSLCAHAYDIHDPVIGCATILAPFVTLRLWEARKKRLRNSRSDASRLRSLAARKKALGLHIDRNYHIVPSALTCRKVCQTRIERPWRWFYVTVEFYVALTFILPSSRPGIPEFAYFSPIFLNLLKLTYLFRHVHVRTFLQYLREAMNGKRRRFNRISELSMLELSWPIEWPTKRG